MITKVEWLMLVSFCSSVTLVVMLWNDKNSSVTKFMAREHNSLSEMIHTAKGTDSNQYLPQLYNKLNDWYWKYNCTMKTTTFNYSNLIFYKPTDYEPPYKAILFTTMYHDSNKQYLFKNVLKNWSLLKPYIQPMLFISSIDIVKKSKILINTAYENGWIIAIAPKCLDSGYPMLKPMFRFVAENFKNISWYGYSNGDIMFTENLWKTLKYIDMVNMNKKKQTEGIQHKFVTGRRYNAYIKDGGNQSSNNAVFKLSKVSKLHSFNAIDYFIYHSSYDIHNKMPQLAIGRRGFDNWLVYHAVYHSKTGIDITQVSPAVHIAIEGKTLRQNSHKTRKKDGNYNTNLPKVKSSGKYVKIGSTNCLPNIALFGSDSSKDSEFKITIHERNSTEICQLMQKKLVKDMQKKTNS